MGTLASLLPMLGAGTDTSNLATNIGLPGSFGKSVGNLGQDIARIGNASSGVIPQTPAVPNAKLTPQVGNQNPLSNQPAQVVSAVAGANTQPMAVQASPQSTTTIPNPSLDANGVPVGTIKGGDLNSIYGVDTGTALTDLYNSEGTGAASTAQAIINANAPNVAQGAANLNTGLAASGISPSSSVSAIENANYEAQVQQQNLSEEAQVSLQEQQMQQQLLEDLLPGQQQRQTDSSGWSIFGDVMSGVGDIFGL